MQSHPLSQFSRHYKSAQKKHDAFLDVMVLATLGNKNRPSARVVLYKGIFNRGIRFYTNYLSQKGRELQQNPYACLLFYWDAIGVQVRIEGKVKKISVKESDRYWACRPKESQISGTVSPQSCEIKNFQYLEDKAKKLRSQYSKKPIPRPEFWGGYDLLPTTFEFWYRGEHRLHQRVLYTKVRENWKRKYLAP